MSVQACVRAGSLLWPKPVADSPTTLWRISTAVVVNSNTCQATCFSTRSPSEQGAVQVNSATTTVSTAWLAALLASGALNQDAFNAASAAFAFDALQTIMAASCAAIGIPYIGPV